MTHARVGAVIPAFNEARSIAAVVERRARPVAHVIVVDDGSTDETADGHARRARKCVEQTSNLGKGHAVRTGLARVLAAASRTCCSSTPTCSTCPRKRRGCSEAAAERRRSRARRAAVRPRRECRRRAITPIGSAAARCRGSSASPVQDTQCGFRVFRVDALRPLRLRATGYEIETEMLVKVRRRGGRVAGVPVTAVYGGSAASCGRCATRRAPVFWRCTIDSSNASNRRRTPVSATRPAERPRRSPAPVDAARSEQRHNFRRDPARRRRASARGVVRDRQRGDVAGVASDARDARPRSPTISARYSPASQRGARTARPRRRCGRTRSDVIDFIRALSHAGRRSARSSSTRPDDARLFVRPARARAAA